MNSLLEIEQYFCSSVMNPISAADTADFSDPAIRWNSIERSAKASSLGRTLIVELSHTSISSWWSSCCGIGPNGGEISSLSEAALDTSHMARMNDKQVTGSGGMPCVDSLDVRMPSILVRSDAEQRDCEIETRVWGSGTLHPYSDLY